MKRTVKNIFATILITGLCAFLLPGLAFGEGEGTIISTTEDGLVIRVLDEIQDTGNLNPGDKKHSCYSLVNEGKGTITVYIKTEIDEESVKSPNGGKLADIMTLTIKDGEKEVISDTFTEVANVGDGATKGNLLLGEMAPESEKVICLYTNLPGNTDNEYQGASFKANWKIKTVKKTGGGGDDSGGGTDRPSRPKTPSDPTVDVDDGSLPEGGPEPGDITEGDIPEIEGESEVVEIVDVEIPFGKPEIPKTGRDLPYPYYVVGALLVLTGLGITFRKKL